MCVYVCVCVFVLLLFPEVLQFVVWFKDCMLVCVCGVVCMGVCVAVMLMCCFVLPCAILSVLCLCCMCLFCYVRLLCRC